MVKCQTMQWVLYLVLLILAWGIGILMLLYLPVRRFILRKDVYKAISLENSNFCFLICSFFFNLLLYLMLHLTWFGWDENWWGRRKDFQYLVLGPTFLLYYLNSKCFFSIFFVSIPFHKTKPYLNVWFCGCVALVTRPVPFSCFGVLKKEKHVLLHSIADVVIEQGDGICSFLMCCSLDGFFLPYYTLSLQNMPNIH